jgi:hypothetical protein
MRDARSEILRIFPIFLAFTVPVAASAQTVRDKNGNALYHYQKQGDRTYVRDNNGNALGYYKSLPNGTTEFRDNNGNLKLKETP